MRQPLILNYYSLLPDQPVDVDPAVWAETQRKALQKYQQAIEARYSESTLQRLLNSSDFCVRRAACIALGLLGTMKINLPLAALLHDEDAVVCEHAADALWSIWFRSADEAHVRELQRVIRLDVNAESADSVIAQFDSLAKAAPHFAEVFNQRAIVHFRLGEYSKSAADCEKTLRLNPVHFGAASGLAQAFLKQRKLRAALRNYRKAFRINPNIDGISDAIDSLEKTLGEEGKR